MMKSVYVFALLFVGIVLAQNNAALIMEPSYNQAKISDTRIADLIAHVAGISPLHAQVDRTNFPTVDIFEKPKVNMFMAVDGITRDFVKDMKLNNFNSENMRKIVNLRGDSTVLLASILTGETRVVHGVYGRKWRPSMETTTNHFPYLTPQGECQVGKITDAVTQSTNGKSLVFTFSSDKIMASALSPHNQIFETHPDWNNFAYFWHKDSQAFWNLHGDGSLATKAEILSALKTFSLPNVKTSFSKSALKFTINGEELVLDAKRPAHFAFIAEIVALSKTVEFLKKQNALVNDDVNDFISLGFYSFNALNDAEKAVAIKILDAALTQFKTEVNELYNGSSKQQIVLLGKSSQEGPVRPASGNKSLRSILKKHEEAETTTTYTGHQVEIFQLSLWVTVGLTAAILLASYIFCNMDTGEDTILYRMTKIQ